MESDIIRHSGAPTNKLDGIPWDIARTIFQNYYVEDSTGSTSQITNEQTRTNIMLLRWASRFQESINQNPENVWDTIKSFPKIRLDQFTRSGFLVNQYKDTFNGYYVVIYADTSKEKTDIYLSIKNPWSGKTTEHNLGFTKDVFKQANLGNKMYLMSFDLEKNNIIRPKTSLKEHIYIIIKAIYNTLKWL